MDLAPLLERAFGRVPRTTLEPLAGQASTRRYYRLHLDDARPGEPASLVVMRLPEDATASDEGGEDEAPAELPFLVVQRLLAERELPVPRVFAEDLPRRALLLEDLGAESFEDRLHARGPAAWPTLYGQAVDLLVQLHERCAALPPEHLAATRAFDQSLLRWELDHFREWGLEIPFGALPPDERATLDAAFDRLARTLAEAPRGFVHRDYQSRNLMWRGDELVLIDFQDALQGPVPYDLVALLCDSYVALDAELQEAMIARYAAARGLDLPPFRALFWRQALQRKLKDAGRFVYIDRVRANPGFLPSFGPSLVYVGRALTELGAELGDEAEEVRAILTRRLPGFPDTVPTPLAATGENA